MAFNTWRVWWVWWVWNRNPPGGKSAEHEKSPPALATGELDWGSCVEWNSSKSEIFLQLLAAYLSANVGWVDASGILDELGGEETTDSLLSILL